MHGNIRILNFFVLTSHSIFEFQESIKLDSHLNQFDCWPSMNTVVFEVIFARSSELARIMMSSNCSIFFLMFLMIFFLNKFWIFLLIKIKETFYKKEERFWEKFSPITTRQWIIGSKIMCGRRTKVCHCTLNFTTYKKNI